MLVITRTKEDNEELLKLLEAEGLSATSYPCLEYKLLDKGIEDLKKSIRANNNFDWIFFLSKKAAEIFFNTLIEMGGNLFNLAPHIKIACIGTGTKKYIENTIGFPVDFMPSQFNSGCFIKEFKEKQLKFESIKILIPRNSKGEDDFQKDLNDPPQVRIDEVPVYTTACPESNGKLGIDSFDICFASSETVRNFKKLQSEAKPNKFYSIGPKTSQTIKEIYGDDAHVIEAQESTFHSLILSIKTIHKV